MKFRILILKIINLLLLDSKWYLEIYSDVKKSNINPYIHFWEYGWKEGRFARKNLKIKRILNLHIIESELDDSIIDKSFILHNYNQLISKPNFKKNINFN